ncbi:hypothetical protein H9L10_04700 [Phycicoccus endophyticus]|uniref:HNH nuclease domain-containing protein n=1 Tax=Phycicoccus endophyticus TaxID=1690220 RepID=A0A7G9R408_9MICO|nr:HNH endonuclease signature motif containing protein [Phycicoccus endophyticus]NHI18172.1 hypothetical protein [Phycicoccus endophyticus]QNN50333.1 hypothetical protein H9L10_04700 [Phycicoccus endophyticus]GGL25900.1 hypothetical protein GCM10012283_05060 [Phycicoccus endophyticus]
MDAGDLADRIAALHEEAAALGRELATHGQALTQDEAYALAGALQGVVNAAEAAQGAVGAWGARFELTLTGTQRVHPLGYVEPMAPSEMALATGVTEGLAGRKVRLGAGTVHRFPVLHDLVLAGKVAASSVHKVLDACSGLDHAACERVDARLSARLPGMDPARVSAQARTVATRVAADQVAARDADTRRGRLVEVSPGEDGMTEWFAALPTATSAAMWAAVESLATDYRALDTDLSVRESRADALSDLVLRNVTVAASVTLGVPVLTGDTGPEARQGERFRIERDDEETVVDAVTGQVTTLGELTPASREEMSWVEMGPEPDGDLTTTMAALSGGTAVSGTPLPGLGWVDPATMAALLGTLPLHVARAVLEADTGTLVSHTSTAYRPPAATRELVTVRDGTCRMWGCTRPADRCDLDHTLPWPEGGTDPGNLAALCRRHHRMKHQGRWRYRLDDTGSVTWHGPDGATRTTEPAHRADR